MKKHFYILLLLGIFFIQAGFSQTIEQAFDLHFQNLQFRGGSYGAALSFDKTQETEDDFYPVKINLVHSKLREDSKGKDGACYFALDRSVILPVRIKKRKCSVTLNCKSDIDSVCFSIIALDKKEKKLCVDSIYIPAHAQWADYTLAFNQKKCQTIKISIGYKGNVDSSLKKNVYLNKINIALDDQNINSYPVSSIIREDDTRLSLKHLVPLSFQDSTSLAGITSWKNKKIISLGESAYGSRETHYSVIQFIKYLITTENCKLVLLESAEDMCIRWNLYFQGKIPDIFEEDLIEDLQAGGLHDYHTTLDLLKWIKRYNATNKDTIRVFGIDNIIGRNTYMADYLLKLSTSKQDSIYYLHAIAHDKYQEVKEYIRQSSIHTLLGDRDLQYLFFLLDEMTHAYPMSDEDYTAEQETNSAKRVEKIISLFLSSTEKAAITAHSQHTNQSVPLRDYDTNHYSFGYYLKQKYKKQYYSITFQVGTGSHRQDSIFTGSRHVAEPLQTPFPFAFEQAALNTASEYFYYPSDRLPKGILGLNLMSRLKKKENSFKFCHIPSPFDALVFIRESSASHVSGKHPAFHFDWYLKGLGERFNLLMEALKE